MHEVVCGRMYSLIHIVLGNTHACNWCVDRCDRYSCVPRSVAVKMSSFANCSRELGIQVRTLAGLRGSASAVALLLTVGLLMVAIYCGVFGKGKKWLNLSIYVLRRLPRCALRQCFLHILSFLLNRGLV